MPSLQIAQDGAADEPLSRDPLALVVGMLLGKQYRATPPGWREAAGDYGQDGARRSVADVTGPESPAEVRAFEQAAEQSVGQSAEEREAASTAS